MLQKYSIHEFCINTYAEENICLNKVDDRWELSIYEKGQKNILKVCYNLVDACFAAFDRYSEKEASMLKDYFITMIIEESVYGRIDNQT